MRKSPEPKESQSKEPSPTIMPLKLKSNTFQRKSKKPSLSTNQSKESGKESNICQLKPKSSTTQKGTTTSPDKVNTSRLVTLTEDTPQPPNTNKEPPTFHPKAESEPKLSTKPVTFQSQDQSSKEVNQLSDKEVSFKEPPNTSQAQLTPTPLTQLDQLSLDKPTPLEVKLTPLEDKPTPLEDKLTLPAEVESEEKTSTDNLKLVVTSPEEVESDNDPICKFHFVPF